MFVERSAGRIRHARTAFLLFGAVPFAVLVAWAIERGSPAHRDQVRDRWQRAVGMRLTIDAVEYPRPGVTRARGVAVVSPAGTRLVAFPVVEVEAGADEDRLRFERVRLDGPAATVFGELAREWLRRDARHPRSCVIDVAGLSWSDDDDFGGAGDAPRGLRIECVARDTARAVRVTRSGAATDLVRIVRSTAADDQGADREAFEIEVQTDEQVPLVVIAGLAGVGGDLSAVAGDAAAVAGRCSATHDERGWHGEASGRLTAIDVSSSVAPLGARADGRAEAEVDRVVWRDGRLVSAAGRVRVGPGWVDAAFADRLTLALGCRPPQTAAVAGERRFDAAGFDLRTEDGRVVIAAPVESPRALAVAGGAAVLHEPAAAVPFERLAWLLSPPSADFVPAGGAGAWLMTIQPREGGAESVRQSTRAPREGSRGF